MIRGIVISVWEGLIKRFSASGRADETIGNREYMQHYGFTSRPLAGAEIIIINEGNHYIGVASDDRRYRLHLEAGECALYTDEGDKIHLKRDKTIEIVSGNKLVATVENEVNITTKVAKVTASTSAEVTAPVATVNAATSCTITSPAVTVNAATSCTINSPSILMGGSSGTMRKLVDERILDWLRNHTHAMGIKPQESLTDADVSTSITQGG